MCGRVDDDGGRISFTYARSYRERPEAVPVYDQELPLTVGTQFAVSGLGLPLCLGDSLPDSWGRRLINHRLGAPTPYASYVDLAHKICDGWDEVCDDAELTSSQRAVFMQRQFLNPGLFD